MWQAWTIGILGLWVVMAAFFGLGVTANLVDNLVVGVLVGVAAATILKKKPWQAWLAMVFAVWMIIAAFIPLLLQGAGYIYNDVISGIMIAIAGFGLFSGTPHPKPV